MENKWQWGEEIESQDIQNVTTQTLSIFTKLMKALVQRALSEPGLCWG